MRDATPDALVSRNLRFGWWALLAFSSLGLVLDGLHGFKVSFYVDVWSQTRRLMWTLGHAHGTLLALLNIAFALTVRGTVPRAGSERRLALASHCLIGAALLMPLGFLLGGAITHEGDPGLGVLLVPPGGALLFAGVLLTARALRARSPGS
jgi:hypothetical protein